MDTLKKTIWYDTNSEPPKNYIWMKADGKAYEYNVGTKQWEESKEFSNASLDMFNEMTEEEKAQVRKDLGLYYEETTTVEKTVQYTDQSESPTLSLYAKISDDTPDKTDIVSFATQSGDGLGFEDRADGYKLYPIGAPSGIEIVVILDDFAGNEPGIYFNLLGAEYASLAVLVYDDPITTISKIPDKYLPVAWNQLVTEGTKIAEVTIGEETTNVFAPEGGGSGVYIAHASQDFQESAGINLSVYFENADDITAVLSGNASIIEVDNSNIKYSFIGKDSSRVYYISGKKILTLSGFAQYCVILFYEISTGSVPGPIEISMLPMASMTAQEELDVTGLTIENIKKLGAGKTTGLLYDGGLLGILYVEPPKIDEPTTYILGFRDASDMYKVLSVSGTITVTVTPLS